MDSIIQTLDETGVPWEPLLLVVLVVLYVLVLDQIVQAILRLTVGRQYSVRIPFSVRVGVDLHPDDVGSFAMGYPQWRSAKKDGTRDRRTNDFHVIKDRTLILLDGWKLRGKNPFEAYDLVRALRRNGQVIVPCQEERLKRSRLASHAMRRRDCGEHRRHHLSVRGPSHGFRRLLRGHVPHPRLDGRDDTSHQRRRI